ncbi:MAG: TrkH family potassium uptake protein, partial [Tuberibacillus sp.]
VLIFVILDRPVSIGQKLMIQEALNQNSVGGIVALAKRLLFFSLFFEGFFAILLFIRFLPDLGFTHSLSYALFFSISAFNNAGISLWPDSLTRYEGDITVNILVSVLVMVGGIGFTVMNDIWEKRRWRAFHLHTKLMLAGTLVINIFAVALIYFIEFDNPKTIGSLSAGEAFWGAFFQGIMTRSGGFNTVDIGGLEPATLFLMMILMFIGSGSVSTGGGIKLTTFICLWAMVIAFIRKKKVPILMKRTIHNYDIFKALTITLLSIGMIFAALFILLLTEKPELSFIHIAFEVVSAFGTTGLSAGVTPHLSVPGQLVMIVMMVFGKLGPLTILFSVAERSTDNIRYPTGKLFIG